MWAERLDSLMSDQMTRLERSAFFSFFAARFSFKVLPCFLLWPDGGALFAMT